MKTIPRSPLLLALLLAATGCNFIEISPGDLEVHVVQVPSGRYRPVDTHVHLKLQGDTLNLVFPEGPPPAWLGIQQEPLAATGRDFDFPITITPPFQGTGSYATTVRFEARDQRDLDVAHRDLPIRLDIHPLLPSAQQSVSFQSASLDPAPPAAQTLQLALESTSGVTWSAKVGQTNHGLTDWLKLTPDFTGNRLEIVPTKVPTTGHYEADIVLTLDQGAGMVDEVHIPLTYDIKPSTPEPRYVAPMVGFLNEAGTLLIRGAGFDTATLLDVRIGGVSATSFELVNPTELRAHYAAFSTVGPKPVELVTAGKTYSAGMDFLIKTRPQAAAFNYQFPTGFAGMVFDSTRDVLIVRTESGLYRFKLGGSGWSLETQRNIHVGRIDLSPDARHLVTIADTRITLMDAVTLEDVEAYSIPYASPAEDPNSSLVYVLDNGTALLTVVVTDASGGRATHSATLNLVNRTLSRKVVDMGWIEQRHATNDREKILAVATDPGGSGAIVNGYFDAAVNAFVSFGPAKTYFMNRIAMSGNGARLLLGEDQVFDASFSYLGTLVSLGNEFVSNYSLELSADGMTGYRVAASDGRIYRYDLQAPAPYPALGALSFTPWFSSGMFPETFVTPDNSMMVLGGGAQVVIVPL